MSAQITHVDPEETIRKLRAKVARLEKALEEQPAQQEPLGKLSVFDDPESDFGWSYDISANYEQHKKLRFLSGTSIYTTPQPPAQQEPVAAECKFDREEKWVRCEVAHHNLVQSEPDKWPGYQTRLLYTRPQAREPHWIDPNDKTQKQYLPHIGEPVLFCHGGKTYTGKHTGGSFQSEVTNQYFNTWECRWMYLPAAHGIKGDA